MTIDELKRKILKVKRHIKVWRFERWLKKHPDAEKLFNGLDAYYPKWDGLDYALSYCLKSLKILSCDAYNCEKYRQQVCRMKILLITSGISAESIEVADLTDNAFGINCLDALVPQNIGTSILDMAKAGNSAEVIRQHIIDEIYGRKSINQ